MAKALLSQPELDGTVGWTRSIHDVTMDGKVVTHFGLDRGMHQYYRTEDGAIYQKQTNGWVMITPVVSFELF